MVLGRGSIEVLGRGRPVVLGMGRTEVLGRGGLRFLGGKACGAAVHLSGFVSAASWHRCALRVPLVPVLSLRVKVTPFLLADRTPGF